VTWRSEWGREVWLSFDLARQGIRASDETVGGGWTGGAVLRATVAVSVRRRQTLRTIGQLRSVLSTRTVAIWPGGPHELLSLPGCSIPLGWPV
jgi:hypothetical protein